MRVSRSEPGGTRARDGEQFGATNGEDHQEDDPADELGDRSQREARDSYRAIEDVVSSQPGVERPARSKWAR